MHSHYYSLNEIHGRRFVEGEADVFIYNRKMSILLTILMYVKVLLHDLKWHFKEKDLLGALLSIPRRWVYQWAYFKGNKLGQSRLNSQNKDTAIGQQVVLNSLTR